MSSSSSSPILSPNNAIAPSPLLRLTEPPNMSQGQAQGSPPGSSVLLDRLGENKAPVLGRSRLLRPMSTFPSPARHSTESAPAAFENRTPNNKPRVSFSEDRGIIPATITIQDEDDGDTESHHRPPSLKEYLLRTLRSTDPISTNPSRKGTLQPPLDPSAPLPLAYPQPQQLGTVTWPSIFRPLSRDQPVASTSRPPQPEPRNRLNRSKPRKKDPPLFVPLDPYRRTTQSLNPIPPAFAFCRNAFNWLTSGLPTRDSGPDSPDTNELESPIERSIMDKLKSHQTRRQGTDPRAESVPEILLPPPVTSPRVGPSPPLNDRDSKAGSEPPLSPAHQHRYPFGSPILDATLGKIEPVAAVTVEVAGKYWDNLIRQTYRYILLRLPSMYFNRVGRVFQEARVSKGDLDILISRGKRSVSSSSTAVAQDADEEERRRWVNQMLDASTPGSKAERLREMWERDGLLANPTMSPELVAAGGRRRDTSFSPNMPTKDLPETGTGTLQYDWSVPHVPPSLERFKDEWEDFVEGLIKEWKTLNIVSALLLSAILTIFQIDEAAQEPLTRTAALLSLVSALTSLVYGCVYILRFSTMRTMRKAARWAEEAQKSTNSIFWNIWVFLALPAAWLAYSVIFFCLSILSFVWTSGDGGAPQLEQSLEQADQATTSGGGRRSSDPVVLIPRIAVTVLLFIAIIYFILIVRTFWAWSGVGLPAPGSATDTPKGGTVRNLDSIEEEPTRGRSRRRGTEAVDASGTRSGNRWWMRWSSRERDPADAIDVPIESGIGTEQRRKTRDNQLDPPIALETLSQPIPQSAQVDLTAQPVVQPVNQSVPQPISQPIPVQISLPVVASPQRPASPGSALGIELNG